MHNWYLIRTKTGSERIAQHQLRGVVDNTILPLASTQFRQKGRAVRRVSPLFPCYIFANFSLGQSARRIQFTPGVRHIVRFGEHVAVVPPCVIEELISHCGDGPVELAEPELRRGAPVKVIDGPLKALQGVFDGYLTGAERVAVLLSVMNAQRRVVMPASMVTATD